MSVAPSNAAASIKTTLTSSTTASNSSSTSKADKAAEASSKPKTSEDTDAKSEGGESAQSFTTKEVDTLKSLLDPKNLLSPLNPFNMAKNQQQQMPTPPPDMSGIGKALEGLAGMAGSKQGEGGGSSGGGSEKASGTSTADKAKPDPTKLANNLPTMRGDEGLKADNGLSLGAINGLRTAESMQEGATETKAPESSIETDKAEENHEPDHSEVAVNEPEPEIDEENV